MKPEIRDQKMQRAGQITSQSEQPLPEQHLDGRHVDDIYKPLLPNQMGRSFSLKQYANACFEFEQAHGQVFIWCAVSLILGAYFNYAAQNNIPDIAIWLPGMGVLAVLILNHHIASKSRAFLKIALAFLIGYGAANIEQQYKGILLDGDVTTTLSGRVTYASTDNSGIKRYIIDVTQTNNPQVRRMPKRVQLVDRSKSKQLAIGVVLDGRARLTSPSGPVLPGGFDFAFSAYTKNIGAYGFFMGAPKIQTGQAILSQSLYQKSQIIINDLRTTISYRINQVLEGQSGAVARALIVSDRVGIQDQTSQSLRAAGLAHILAISGLHMALAAGILFVGLRLLFSFFPAWVQLFPVKNIAAIGAIITSSIYLAISGAPVSAQRAWIMLFIVLVAVLLNRQALTIRNVAIAAIMIVIMSPSAVMTPGFQMSFAATAALVATYSHWIMRNSDEKKASGLLTMAVFSIIKTMIGLALTAIVAGAATGIFSIQHFNEFPAYGVLGNILAMPVVTFLVMPSALLSVLLMPYGLEALTLNIMGFGIDLVIQIATWVEGLGGLLQVGTTASTVAMLYISGLLIFLGFKSSVRYSGLVVIVIGLISSQFIAVQKPALLISEDGKLIAYNNGQNLSVNRQRPSEFTLDQWKGAFVLEEQKPQFPFSRSEVEQLLDEGIATASQKLIELSKNAPNEFVCINTHICLIQSQNVSLISIGKPEYKEFACGGFDYAIFAFRTYYSSDNCIEKKTKVIDQNTLRRTGSIAIYKTNDNHFVEQSSISDKNRPWTIQRYYNWRSQSYKLPSGKTLAQNNEGRLDPVVSDNDE